MVGCDAVDCDFILRYRANDRNPGEALRWALYLC